MEKIKNLSNSFIVYALLALSGGFMDAYSYLGRDKVFANAQTGNLILLGVNIAEQNWNLVPKYCLPVLFFVVGIALAASLKYLIKRKPKLCSLTIVLLEALIMFGVMCISTEYNLIANSLISFACGMQVEHFRELNNQSIATTMCIGNLRAGTSAICKSIFEKDKKHFKIGMMFYGTIFTFVIGAIIGNFVLKLLDLYALCVSGILLIIVSFIIVFDILHKKRKMEITD